MVVGKFVGTVEDRGIMLRITGDSKFEFSDDFADPLNLAIEAGGTPYKIVGSWTARFTAEIFKDPTSSHFVDNEER